MERFPVSSVTEPLGSLSYIFVHVLLILLFQLLNRVSLLNCLLFPLTDIHYKGANLRLEVVKTMKHLLSKYCRMCVCVCVHSFEY